jgi:hypothetical protein
MRAFIAGQSLDPVLGLTYGVTEDIGEPDRVVLFKEQITDENAGNFPSDAAGKVEFINKVLADKGLAEMTAEEIQFVGGV